MEGQGKGSKSSETVIVEKEAWVIAIDHYVKSIPVSRRKKAKGTLLGFAKGTEMHPDLAVRKHPEEVRREDFEAFFARLNECEYKDWTVHDFKLILRQFCKKLMGKRFVEWIKVPRNIRSRLGPEDLITKEDLQRMVSAAETPRDKAIVTE